MGRLWEGSKVWIKNHPPIKRLVLWGIRVLTPVFPVSPAAIPRYAGFFFDWLRFRRAGGRAKILDFYPCLFDKTGTTKLDSQYFYQAIWAFKRMSASGVTSHVDVGSDIRLVGMLTCISHVTFIDIRPLKVTLDRYTGKKGSILALPFGDRSVPSLSSLHVVEHIGLGRYGDAIDPDGTVKACQELRRVLAPGGMLYVSLPIGRTRVQFNGQRVLAVDDVLRMFHGLRCVELSIVAADGAYHEDVDPGTVKISENAGADCGLGMFMFKAPNGDNGAQSRESAL